MAGSPAAKEIREAYGYCAALARQHYENFPVASLLLPSAMRPHLAAVYAFARTADDFADEPGRSQAERLHLLDEWSERLERAGSDPGAGHPVFVALAQTIRVCRLPVHLLADLLSAFRQDVLVSRYSTWDDVFDYCRRSANPVGRLVLWIAGVRDDRTAAASDAVCTALQLTNFWQDFGRDWQNGRLYIPREQQRDAGATEKDLDGPSMTPEWVSAMRASVDRTRELFLSGRDVADLVHGRLRWELRATWLGGMRILDKVQALGYDTLHRRPKLTPVDALAIVAHAAAWRRDR